MWPAPPRSRVGRVQSDRQRGTATPVWADPDGEGLRSSRRHRGGPPDGSSSRRPGLVIVHCGAKVDPVALVAHMAVSRRGETGLAAVAWDWLAPESRGPGANRAAGG